MTTSFRRFAADKLASLREAVWERLVTHFLEDQESDRSLDVLPTYLEKTNRTQELLSLLSPRTFIRWVERTDTFEPLRRRSQLGLTTALKLNRVADALRFGLQTSTVADVSSFEVAKSEVLARLAVDDYPSALALAQGSALKHQRLQLLVAIARQQHEKDLTPESAVLDAIEQLVRQVDVSEIQDTLVDIASDLMYSRPDLSIELVSRTAPRTSDDRGMDWAFVQLSAVAEMNRGPSTGRGLHGTADELRSRITDPAARRYSNAIAMVVGNYTVDEILRHVETLESAGDRIFLLRQWCMRTSRAIQSAPIIDYAVHLAIRTTEYTPTARDFMDLAMPLPRVEDVDKLSALITAFDIHRESARQTGPIQDYVQLQLLIAEAENRISPVRAGQRLLETYYEVSSLADLEVRTVCKGLIVAAISDIDPSGAFDDSNDVKTIVQQEFERESQQLLSDTADHYEVTRAIIRSIAKAKPQLALNIIRNLNLENRRDLALTDLVTSLLELPGKDLPIEFLRNILGQFSDKDEEDSFVFDLLRRVSRISTVSWLQTALPYLRVFIARSRDISDPVLACSALSAAVVVFAKLNDSDLQSLQNGVMDTLKNKWDSIDDPSERLQAGYETVRRLADYRRELALSYLANTDSLRRSHQDLTGPTFLACLLLAIRAYSGLLPGRIENASDFDRLALQIERVPSRMYRVYLWTELALRCFKHERSDDAKRIVAQKVRPLLDKLKEDSPHEWCRATALAAPAMWESNSGAAPEYLSQLPQHDQDIAFERILHFKLTRVPPAEPYSFTGNTTYQLDLDKCVEILKIIEYVDVDFTAYKYIEAVAKSAAWRHDRFALSQTQKTELADRIKRLSSKKFPNSRFITHDGFGILAEGQATRLLKERAAQWQPLTDRARALRNAADRAFVIAFLAEMMHSGLSSERGAMVREAKLAADAIPSLIDRVDRYRLIAGVAFDLDQAFARQVFSEAMNSVAQKNSQECEEARRQLVDSAYQVDVDFAYLPRVIP